MPEVDNNDHEVPAEAAKEVAKPITEADRKRLHLEMLGRESDQDRERRRANELNAPYDVHKLNVERAHEMYPARPHVAFFDLTTAEQENWNKRRHDIDMANKAYHRAVRDTVATHVAEDAHLAKLRAVKPAA